MFGEVNVSSEVVVIDRDSWKGWVVPCAHSERREEDEKKLCVRYRVFFFTRSSLKIVEVLGSRKKKEKGKICMLQKIPTQLGHVLPHVQCVYRTACLNENKTTKQHFFNYMYMFMKVFKI